MLEFADKTITLRTLGKSTYTYLSAAAAPKTSIDTFVRDDGSGRQRWVVQVFGEDTVALKLAEPGRDVLLSAAESAVVLREQTEGGPGPEQLWRFETLDGAAVALRNVARSAYLSSHDDNWDNAVDLWGELGPEGRQSWAVALAGSSRPGRLLAIDPALQLPEWGAAPKRTRLSYDAASGGIRINYPASPHASAGGTNWGFRPPGLFPAREARVSCEVYVPPDFPFEASGSSAGKLGIGIDVGAGPASGGNWSSNGASFRPCWIGAERDGSNAMAYVYCEVSNPDNFREHMDQAPGVLDSAVLTNGGANMFRKVPNPMRIYKGKWNAIEVYMKLNTPGKMDGVCEMSVNGVQYRVDNFRWVLPGSRSMVEKFWTASWFGGSGSDPSWSPGRPCYTIVRDVVVWTDQL